MDWYPFEPKKVNKKHQMLHSAISGIRMSSPHKCTESLSKVAIMNVEVETNVKTEILS